MQTLRELIMIHLAERRMAVFRTTDDGLAIKNLKRVFGDDWSSDLEVWDPTSRG